MFLFWSILQLPMDFSVFMRIPEDLMVLACILNYLIGGLNSGPCLKPLDVAVFVAQAVLDKDITKLKELPVIIIHVYLMYVMFRAS